MLTHESICILNSLPTYWHSFTKYDRHMIFLSCSSDVRSESLLLKEKESKIDRVRYENLDSVALQNTKITETAEKEFKDL